LSFLTEFAYGPILPAFASAEQFPVMKTGARLPMVCASPHLFDRSAAGGWTAIADSEGAA
jgi:hypothetical protein